MTKKKTSTESEPVEAPQAWSVWQSFWVSLSVFFAPQFAILVPVTAVMMAAGHESLEATFDAYEPWLVNTLAALFVTALGGLILHTFIKTRGGLAALGFKRTNIDDMVTVLPVFFGYFLTIAGVFTLISVYLPSVDLDQTQSTGFEDGQQSIELIAAFFTLVILAPIYEEALFRGFAFQGVAKRYGYWPAAIVTSGLFGLAHMQLNVGIDTFVLGMFASWLVWHTKSIWPAIALHMIKNILAYLFIFVFKV